MGKEIYKYNPGFLSDQELENSFVVRLEELDLILEILRENTENEANQHILLIGPRGMGKTTLIHRVALAVKKDAELNSKWYPLIFSEEGYEILSAGELWLESLFHLAQQEKDDQWEKTYRELKEERNEQHLYHRALAQLMDFADRQQKKILLMVENLNHLLGDQIDEKGQWKLRHTLINEPRIMLLGTAASRFKEIENSGKAWYELLKEISLESLQEKDSLALWKSISNLKLTERQIRPIRILTGGNPRLLTILSSFAAHSSFKKLMDDLIQLVDDHTDYFKSNLESLPPKEKKVFVTLLNGWEPRTAAEIAEEARISVNEASSNLNRLVKRGAVEETKKGRRKKCYQATERLYNIYYLMRRRSQHASRVEAVVDFMLRFYDPARIPGLISSITYEAIKMDPEICQNHYWAYEKMLNQIDSKKMKEQILEETPLEFLDSPSSPASLKKLTEKAILQKLERDPQQSELWEQLAEILWDKKDWKKAEKTYKKAIKINPENHTAWHNLGYLYFELNQMKKAERAFKKAIEINPKDHSAWIDLQALCWFLNQREETERVYKAIQINPKDHSAWYNLGNLYSKLQRPKEAEEAYKKALKLKPDDPRAWLNLIKLQKEDKKNTEEAFRTIEKFLKQNKNSTNSLNNLVWLFFKNQWREHYPQAEKWAREAVEKTGSDNQENLHYYKHTLASILGAQNKWEEALNLAPDFLILEDAVQKIMTGIIEFFTCAAAAGHAEKAAEILAQTPAAKLMEPLLAALQMYAGQEVRVPYEVQEVAKDVVAQIEEKAKER